MTLHKKAQENSRMRRAVCPPMRRGIMSASSTPRFASTAALLLTTVARQPHPLSPPPPPPSSRTDRDSWRAINSSNRTNGLVVATHVCLPLWRSSLARHVHRLIFSCFSAFSYSHLSSTPILTTQLFSLFYLFVWIAAVYFFNERAPRIFSISGLTYNSTKTSVGLISRTFGNQDVPFVMIGQNTGSMRGGAGLRMVPSSALKQAQNAARQARRR
jgi:hypothetical protein